MSELFNNNAVAATTASINNSSDPVSFTVDNTTPFPSSGNFRVIIDTEILLVTGVSGSTFTAKRAQEGTSIASHSSGAAITHVLTAASIQQIIKENCWRPYELFVPATYDDEFDDNNFSGWTTINNTGGTVTVDEYQSNLAVKTPGGGTAPCPVAFMKACTLSIGDWIEIAFRAGGTNQNFSICGLLMADGVTSGSGTQADCYFSGTEQTVVMGHFTGYNTNAGQAGANIAADQYYFVRSHFFLRMTYTAANSFKASVSVNGKHWVDIATFSVTVTPTYIGFFCSNWSGSEPKSFDIEYFRKGP